MFNILHVLVDMKYEPRCERKTKIKEIKTLIHFQSICNWQKKKKKKQRWKYDLITWFMTQHSASPWR